MSRSHVPSVLLMLLAAFVLVVAAGGTLRAQGKAEVALKAAMDKEVVDGDLRAAIELYRKVSQGSDRAVAARALVRMGQCYEKLGEAEAREARKAYDQVVRDFGDQPALVAEARARLAALAATLPAAGSTTGGLKLTRVYAGSTYAVSISPDGSQLVLGRSEMSSRDVWSRNIATGRESRLTNGISVSADPVWSPDSQWIAFADRGLEIKVVPANGGDTRTVFRAASGSEPDAGLAPANWTSDSRKVVFRVPSKGLFAVPVAGGEPEPVCTFENPEDAKKHEAMTLSPDGRLVAYSATENGNTDIFVVPIEGRNPVRVTSSPAAERRPRWSPDGNWLAFTSLGNENPQIWAIKISRDGRPDGPAVQVSRDQQVFGADWTSGGRIGFSAPFRIEHIFTANADGTGQTQLTQFSSFHAKPRWSPDGQWIAFRSDYRKPLNRFRLWVVSSAGGTPRLVVDREVGSIFVWSKDGQKLLFETGAGLNRSTIMGIPTQGGEAREIVTLDGDIDGLSLSRDGGSLYYTFTMEPARYATTDEYLKERASGLGVVPVGGGQPRILIPADRKGISYSDCRVDPDGKRIAYMVFDHGQFKKQGMYSIWTLDLDGDAPRKIRNGGEYLLCWSPDGKWIVYEQRIKEMDFELYKVPVDGGEPVRMNIRGRSAEFSPDGKRIAYSTRVDSPPYEYWLAENVLTAPAGRAK